MQNELLSLTQDLLKLLSPLKKRGGNTLSNPTPPQKIPQKKVPETISLKIPTIHPKPQEKKPVEKERPLPTHNFELTLQDLKDWYEKRFKTPTITPLNDQRALTAKMRFREGTDKAAVALLVPKNVSSGALYKNIQTAIHNYITPCTLLLIEQFSKESSETTRLLLTDPSWLAPFEGAIHRNKETKTDTLFSIPIVYLEPLEKIRTPEGKERLWQALQQLPHL